MTEQWKHAMEKLQSMESNSCQSRWKWKIDEALDQMLDWTESTRDPEELVHNALQNAEKRVCRREKKQCELDGGDVEPAAPRSLKVEQLEWEDLVACIGLTERERLVTLRSGQGYCVQEIASEFGTTDKAVYHLRDRSRAKIRAAWSKVA